MPKPLKPAETRAYLEDNPDKSPTNNYPVIKGTVTVNAEQVTILKEMTALGKEARLSHHRLHQTGSGTYDTDPRQANHAACGRSPCPACVRVTPCSGRQQRCHL